MIMSIHVPSPEQPEIQILQSSQPKCFTIASGAAVQHQVRLLHHFPFIWVPQPLGPLPRCSHRSWMNDLAMYKATVCEFLNTCVGKACWSCLPHAWFPQQQKKEVPAAAKLVTVSAHMSLALKTVWILSPQRRLLTSFMGLSSFHWPTKPPFTSTTGRAVLSWQMWQIVVHCRCYEFPII